MKDDNNCSFQQECSVLARSTDKESLHLQPAKVWNISPVSVSVWADKSSTEWQGNIEVEIERLKGLKD